MRYALIMAGGSGTRLWPMSRLELPKQLVPFLNGRSLLEVAFERLEGLVPAGNRYVCAARKHAELISAALSLPPAQFLGEPIGRDTLNAVGFSAAVIAGRDPDAVIAVFTADHVIEPVDRLRAIVEQGYRLAEAMPSTLVTFGIQPTTAATSYGYLELGEDLGDGARVVRQFKEKPDQATAQRYFAAGPTRYLWNSGMFVWHATTLLECVRRYAPANAAGLAAIGEAWDTPRRDATLSSVFPTLRKTSVDFAVMEPASRDPEVRVVAVPMSLTWLDVGSWPSFAETCAGDGRGNRVSAKHALLVETDGTVVASSDPGHLVATVGCRDLIVVHTADATLVCAKDRAESIKDLHKLVAERFGGRFV